MPPPRPVNYGLSLPTQSEAKATLAKFLGPKSNDVWAETCRACDLEHGAPTLDQLEKAAGYLVKLGGLPRVVGNGLLVRIRSYRKLMKVSL